MQRPGLERQNTMSKAKGLHPGQSYAEVLAEARRLGAGQLWEDRVFSHKGDACLYDRNKPASQRQVFNGGNKIKWCRARDVKGAEASRLKLIEGTAEAGEVEQGELGDCYLLGAMSSVANLKDESGASHIRKLLKSSDADLQLGFATFLLYKFGAWVEVTVDTWLPCKSDADRALIFAQNAKEPNELWVSLLEKAYAKLHGSYEALDGGSVTAALVDLSGGVTESIDLMDDEAMIEVLDGSMFKRLQRYNKKKNYLLGAAYSRKDVKDQGGMTDTLMQVRRWAATLPPPPPPPPPPLTSASLRSADRHGHHGEPRVHAARRAEGGRGPHGGGEAAQAAQPVGAERVEGAVVRRRGGVEDGDRPEGEGGARRPVRQRRHLLDRVGGLPVALQQGV